MDSEAVVGEITKQPEPQLEVATKAIKGLSILQRAGKMLQDPIIRDMAPAVVAGALGILAGLNIEHLSAISGLDQHLLAKILSAAGGAVAGTIAKPVSGHWENLPKAVSKPLNAIVGAAVGIDTTGLLSAAIQAQPEQQAAIAGSLGIADDLLIPGAVAAKVVGGKVGEAARNNLANVRQKIEALVPKPQPKKINTV